MTRAPCIPFVLPKQLLHASSVGAFKRPHPDYAIPSPFSYALAKRQVVTRPIRIRPTSWFKESRGQDF